MIRETEHKRMRQPSVATETRDAQREAAKSQLQQQRSQALMEAQHARVARAVQGEYEKREYLKRMQHMRAQQAEGDGYGFKRPAQSPQIGAASGRPWAMPQVSPQRPWAVATPRPRPAAQRSIVAVPEPKPVSPARPWVQKPTAVASPPEDPAQPAPVQQAAPARPGQLKKQWLSATEVHRISPQPVRAAEPEVDPRPPHPAVTISPPLAAVPKTKPSEEHALMHQLRADLLTEQREATQPET